MSKISTPCVQICSMSPAIKGCLGCFRSRDEIASWLRYNEDERLAIMAELPARKEAFRALKAARKALKIDQSSSEG